MLPNERLARWNRTNNLRRARTRFETRAKRRARLRVSKREKERDRKTESNAAPFPSSIDSRHEQIESRYTQCILILHLARVIYQPMRIHDPRERSPEWSRDLLAFGALRVRTRAANFSPERASSNPKSTQNTLDTRFIHSARTDRAHWPAIRIESTISRHAEISWSFGETMTTRIGAARIRRRALVGDAIRESRDSSRRQWRHWWRDFSGISPHS